MFESPFSVGFLQQAMGIVYRDRLCYLLVIKCIYY